MKPLLTQQDAADYLRVKPRTLEVQRTRGMGPRYCKVGNLVRYREQDLIEYAEGNMRTSTTDDIAAPALPA